MNRFDRKHPAATANAAVLIGGATCIVLSALARPLPAQPAPPPPLKAGQTAAGSMEQVVQFVTATAFRGITVSDEQRARARTIIIAATQEQLRLDTADPMFPDRRQAIVDRRRLALRALLTDDSDRERFDRNSRDLEP